MGRVLLSNELGGGAVLINLIYSVLLHSGRQNWWPIVHAGVDFDAPIQIIGGVGDQYWKAVRPLLPDSTFVQLINALIIQL